MVICVMLEGSTGVGRRPGKGQTMLGGAGGLHSAGSSG